MGFYVMIAAFILGIYLLYYGLIKKKENQYKHMAVIVGILSVAFAVYLGWPK